MKERSLVWITGAAGLIGSHLVRLAANHFPNHRVVGLTRSVVDLTNHAEVRERFEREHPWVIIHCAAMSRSPDCEAHPIQARAINIDATRNLATLAEEIPFFFLSSDLVFDGEKGFYTESDPVNPLGLYAETKVEAEQFVLSNPLHTVVRTSLNAGPSPDGARAFDESMRDAWDKGKTLKLFTDEYRCPIPGETTAAAIWALVTARATGLYHLAGAERLSRWQIGELVAQRFPGQKALIEAASRKEYQGPCRAADTSLDCSKVAPLLPFPLPRFSEWVKQHMKQRGN